MGQIEQQALSALFSLAAGGLLMAIAGLIRWLIKLAVQVRELRADVNRLDEHVFPHQSARGSWRGDEG